MTLDREKYEHSWTQTDALQIFGQALDVDLEVENDAFIGREKTRLKEEGQAFITSDYLPALEN